MRRDRDSSLFSTRRSRLTTTRSGVGPFASRRRRGDYRQDRRDETLTVAYSVAVCVWNCSHTHTGWLAAAHSECVCVCVCVRVWTRRDARATHREDPPLQGRGGEGMVENTKLDAARSNSRYRPTHCSSLGCPFCHSLFMIRNIRSRPVTYLRSFVECDSLTIRDHHHSSQPCVSIGHHSSQPWEELADRYTRGPPTGRASSPPNGTKQNNGRASKKEPNKTMDARRLNTWHGLALSRGGDATGRAVCSTVW